MPDAEESMTVKLFCYLTGESRQLLDTLMSDSVSARRTNSTNSSAMRERLLRDENITLDKFLQICRATELSRENSKTLQGQTVSQSPYTETECKERQRQQDLL